MHPTNPQMLRERITHLEQRLANARTREIMLLEKLIALEAKFELEKEKIVSYLDEDMPDETDPATREKNLRRKIARLQEENSRLSANASWASENNRLDKERERLRDGGQGAL